MLGIKINNEFLDLVPGTTLQLEQNNPFTQFGDEVQGEYSYPVELPITDKNLRLLQLAPLLQTRADKISIDAVVYDNGFQHSRGKLRIEQPTIHLNSIKKGRISVYYLTGISSFYKDVENMQLRSIDLGGVRTFAWDSGDTSSYNTAGSGFWGHIHSVINATPGYGISGYDYGFFPCINKDYFQDHVDLMNKVQLSGSTPVFTQYVQVPGSSVKQINPIVPFPYLKYVLMKAIEKTGWTIEGDVLDDADFVKIVMWNQRSIRWGYPKIVGTSVTWFGYPTIKFNLVDYLPDIKISEFLIAIKNRLGWWYDFDRTNKIIRVKKLVSVSDTGVKDLTRFANPVVIKKVFSEKKTYAVKTNEGDAVLDTSKLNYQGEVNSVADLPAAAEALVEQVYLVKIENNYYICQQDDSGTWIWAILEANTGGIIPENPEAEIVTSALTCGSEKYDSYLDMLPRRDEQGIKTGVFGEDYDFASIVLLFNHGMQLNAAGQYYPLGSHHIYASHGEQVGNWSLAYKAKKTDGTEVGLYDVFFKKFIDTITVGEEIDVTLALPLIDFLQLKFGDVISIKNVRMYIKTIKPTIPYRNTLTVEALRI